ncbi:MAG: stage II sporulation protein D [Clostridiales bacterium]|nr:stage II sporulation protein D [Clostridiales bacterium]
MHYEYMINMIRLRKIFLIYISIFILIVILANIIYVSSNGQATKLSNIEYKEVLEYEGENILVNVYLADTNETITMDLEEYIKGVVAAEMPASYEIEALKAQAIVARTYTIDKIISNRQFGNSNHPNSDICSDINDCQAYISKVERMKKWEQAGSNEIELWNKIEEAVNTTRKQIITYNGQPIKAFFHANSGGKTENVELVWSGEPIDYLKSVETMGENNFSSYSSNAQYSYQEFTEIIKKKYSNFEIDFNNNNCIEILEKSDSNRILRIKIGNIELSGVDVRTMFSLKSTNFEIKLDGNKVYFSVTGYGHGVGMSQNGANALALSGKKCFEIISHYYTNVEITSL